MAHASRAKQDKPARLDAEAWIAAAFDALAAGGIDAVRVEPLAKVLDITKGSFYWHFADRRALLDAMLAAWSEGRITAIREQAAARGAPDAVLSDLGDLFAALGWPRAEAQARAILFYSYLFGQSLLDAQVVPAAARDKAVRALI